MVTIGCCVSQLPVQLVHVHVDISCLLSCTLAIYYVCST